MAISSSHSIVVAFFDDHSDAANAVRDLQSAGFRSDQIGTSYEGYNVDDRDVNTSSVTSSEDQRSFWQKIEDFFSGEEPDHKDHTDITDRNAGRSAAGLAIPDRYRDRLGAGGELLTVRSTDRLSEAEQILTRNNGQIDRDHDSYTEHPSSGRGIGQGTRAGVTGGAMTPGTQAAETATGEVQTDGGYGGNLGRDTDERRIELISEVLRVRKDRVARGEVRLRKEVRTETQTVQVPVTREEIVIERNPVEGGPAATGQIGTDSEIRVPLSEERVQVEKIPVVTEEVRVAKRPVSDTQTVRDQVRREELEVDGADDDLRPNLNKRTA